MPRAQDGTRGYVPTGEQRVPQPGEYLSYLGNIWFRELGDTGAWGAYSIYVPDVPKVFGVDEASIVRAPEPEVGVVPAKGCDD